MNKVVGLQLKYYSIGRLKVGRVSTLAQPFRSGFIAPESHDSIYDPHEPQLKLIQQTLVISMCNEVSMKGTDISSMC